MPEGWQGAADKLITKQRMRSVSKDTLQEQIWLRNIQSTKVKNKQIRFFLKEQKHKLTKCFDLHDVNMMITIVSWYQYQSLGTFVKHYHIRNMC